MAPDPSTGPGEDDADGGLHEEAGRLLAEAEGLPAGERRAFLEREAGDRAELVALLLSLERDLEAAEGFLSDSPGRRLREEAASQTGDEPGPGARFGDFRLLRRLARGGMGTVYEAEQSSPRRRVALKLIAPGLASTDVLRRFRQEGELLARMSHPGIAQVLAVSEADAPEPWFAMELVDGLPLTEHAESLALGIPERLGLLAATADAVAHAHARGIVHRDLKPANVLVDREGRPRVLDFGVARASELETRATNLLTRTGDLVGTLAYMSPEQAWGRQDEVDARTDVFALGVMGFELLTGRLPRRVEDLSVGEALHVLREGEVESAANVDPRLKGDVSTLLGKALAADPSRRYANAAELAADLRRLLSNEPIVARPPSLAYRASKFLRRHRTLALSTGAAFVAVTLVAALALRSAAEASRAEAAASAQAYRASLAAAAAALESHAAAVAASHLEAAPEALRGWEWSVLRSRRGEPAAVTRVPGARGAAFTASGESLLVLADAPETARLVELRLPDLVPIGETRPIGDALPVPPPARAMFALHLLDRPSPRGVEVELLGEPPRRLQVPAASAPGATAVSANLRRAVLQLRERPGRGVFDLRTGELLWEGLEGHPVFSPDGSRLASLDDFGIRLLDAADGRLVADIEAEDSHAPGERGRFMSLRFSADGSSLFVASLGDRARLLRFDAADGTLLATLSPEARPGWQTDHWAAAAAAPRVAWSAGDGSLSLFDDELSRRLAVLSGPGRRRVVDLALSADGEQLAAVDDEGRVLLWLLARELQPRSIEAHQGYGYGLAVSPDGTKLATAGWDRRLRTWDARSLEPLSSLSVGAPGDEPASVAWLPDGERLLLIGTSGRLRVHEAAAGTRQLDLDLGPGTPVLRVELSPDGRRAATSPGYADRQVRVVELATGEPVPSLGGLVEAAAWSPDGRRLAGRVESGEGVFVELADGERRHFPLEAPLSSLLRLAFSPDGELLLAATRTGTTLVLDGRDGRLLHRLAAPEGGFTHDALALPDGRRIVTGAEDGGLRVWDRATGELLAAWIEHDLYVRTLAWDDASGTLWSIAGDGTLRRWSASPP